MTPLIVIFCYLVITAVIGVYAWWRGRVTADDYYISNRSQGFIVTALAIMATFFSTFAMLGAPGMLYTGGIGFVFFMLNVPICGALIWIIGKPIWELGKRFDYITPSDLVADYFKSDFLRIALAVLGIIYVIPFSVIQFKGGGLLFEIITRNSPFDLGFFKLADGIITIGGLKMSTFVFGAVLLTTVTMVYTILGGMRAVCWTNVLQGGMLMAGMLAGGVIVLIKLGGVTGMFQQASGIEIPGTAAHSYMTLPGPKGMYPITQIFSFVLVASIGTMASPGQWMRYYSAKGPDALRKSMLVFAIALTACYFFGTAFIGIGGRVLVPALENPDNVYLVILERNLPLILSSIIVTTIMAAAMSTVNGNIHSMAALVTKDIYQRFLHVKAGERELVWVGRIVITLASVLSLWIALLPDIGLIVQIGLLAMAVAMQMAPSLVGPLYWKGATRAGTIWGVVLGTAVMLVSFRPEWFGLGGIVPRSPLGIHYGFWGFMVNLAALYVVSKLTTPPDTRTIERFHKAS